MESKFLTQQTNPEKIWLSLKLQIFDKETKLLLKQETDLHFYNHSAANGLYYGQKYSEKKYSVGGLGDGACDGVLNVPAYQYDLGDCCKPLKGERNQKPHNAICNYEDDCICHMFTDFHGRI